MRGGLRRVRLSAAVLVGPVTVLAIAAVVLSRMPGDPVTHALGDGSFDAVQPRVVSVPRLLTATVSVELTAPQPLRAGPGAGGIITSLVLEPGHELRNGSRIGAIDGVPIVALATSQPLHRPIGENDVGPDVRALGQALAELGYLSPEHVGDRADWAVLQAVNAFHRTVHGGATDLRRFEPWWVVWIPTPSVTVVSVTAQVGAPVADVLGEVQVGPTSVTVTGPDGEPIPERRWRELALTSVEGSLPLHEGATIADLVADPRSVVPPVDSSGAGSNPSRPHVSYRVEAHDHQQIEGAVLPLTALLGAPGSECVVVVDRDGDHRTVRVEVLGADGGRPVVAGIPPEVRVATRPDPRAHRCAG